MIQTWERAGGLPVQISGHIRMWAVSVEQAPGLWDVRKERAGRQQTREEAV